MTSDQQAFAFTPGIWNDIPKWNGTIINVINYSVWQVKLSAVNMRKRYVHNYSKYSW